MRVGRYTTQVCSLCTQRGEHADQFRICCIQSSRAEPASHSCKTAGSLTVSTSEGLIQTRGMLLLMNIFKNKAIMCIQRAAMTPVLGRNLNLVPWSISFLYWLLRSISCRIIRAGSRIYRDHESANFTSSMFSPQVILCRSKVYN